MPPPPRDFPPEAEGPVSVLSMTSPTRTNSKLHMGLKLFLNGKTAVQTSGLELRKVTDTPHTRPIHGNNCRMPKIGRYRRIGCTASPLTESQTNSFPTQLGRCPTVRHVSHSQTEGLPTTSLTKNQIKAPLIHSLAVILPSYTQTGVLPTPKQS